MRAHFMAGQCNRRAVPVDDSCGPSLKPLVAGSAGRHSTHRRGEGVSAGDDDAGRG